MNGYKQKFQMTRWLGEKNPFLLKISHVQRRYGGNFSRIIGYL